MWGSTPLLLMEELRVLSSLLITGCQTESGVYGQADCVLASPIHFSVVFFSLASCVIIPQPVFSFFKKNIFRIR